MRRIKLLSPLLLAGLAGCTALDRVPFEHVADCPKETIQTLSARQDQFGPRSETKSLECALDFLRKHGDQSLRRGPLASRICLCLAERNTDQTRRQRLAAEGVDFAEAAVALGGAGDGAVHYYLAANLGLMVRDDVAQAAASIPRLEAAMKRAVELSPDLDYGGPLRLLGMLYLKAPPWPTGIGDGDKALDLLRRTVDRHPDHPLNHLFYAQALWEVEGEAAADRVKTGIATGMKLLQEGDWGHNRAPWSKEFAAVQDEIGGFVR